MKSKKYIIPTAILAALWLAASVFCWAKPQSDVSVSERRLLASFPTLSIQSLISGSFSRDFESAALDQFPARDTFRSIKALSVYCMLRQKDNNGIYVSDGFISKLEFPENLSSAEKAAAKLRSIYDDWLAGHAEHIYLSIVPDKNYFLAEKVGYPHMDYDALISTITDSTDFANYIDIFPYLSIEDYYKTDSHWRQERLEPIAAALGSAMGVTLSDKHNVIDTGIDFRGVYYGQSALPLPGEKMYYLTGGAIDSCIAFNPISGEYSQVYTTDKLTSRDPYELYLSGNTPVICLQNPSNTSGRRLIIFRDSFASSLAPLLAEGYSEIVLADTRYISPSLLGNYISFDGADVLFIYSTSLLNSSSILK